MNKASTFLLTILSAWLIVGPAAGLECRHAPIAGTYSKYRIINHQRCWYSSARVRGASSQFSPNGREWSYREVGPGRPETIRRHVHHHSSGLPSDRSMPDQRAADPASKEVMPHTLETRGKHNVRPLPTPPAAAGADLSGEGWTPAEQIEMRWPSYDGSFRQLGMVQ